MALMADRGLFEDMPEAAIFADTQWEPKAVYENVQWLSETITSFPIVTVTAGNLKEKIMLALKTNQKEDFISIPLYARHPNGKMGISSRQCTRQHKIAPIEKEIRQRLGLKFRARWPKDIQVVSWQGISLDEAVRRMSVNRREPSIVNYYPLVDKRISRHDCLNWFSKHYPRRELHRSSCIGCPYHSTAEHDRMAKQEPDEWDTVLEMDRLGQNLTPQMYFNPRGIPLQKVVDDYTSRKENQPELLGEECTGYCYT